jgi:hypothetical protein
MDDWLTLPPNRKSLPVGRLCVILALTALLLIVSQVRHGGKAQVAVAEVPLR